MLTLSISAAAHGGFASTEVFLPAVGRITANGGAQFFTTVWATNLTNVAETFKFEFLKQGQANESPASFTDSLAPGETKVYENVVETKLGLASAIGAARVTSSGEIFVSERIFDQPPGADLGDTQGLFFAGVPKTFSISAGQSASIQGLNQGGSENFRYNFALVETGGGSPTINVQVFDGNGALLGQKAYALQPFEQLQPNVADVVPGFSSINARLTATVTGGTGSLLLAGALLANVSEDSSGFEMSFRDNLLGGGPAGVTSLNGLTGALTIAHGANTTVNVNGSTITIDSVGGGAGSGLTAVAHDNSLAGSGTVAIPLGIANGQVVRSFNGLHDAITLAAGTNVTLTPSGNTITIASSASGGSGGLTSVTHDATLAGAGTGASPLGIAAGGVGNAQLGSSAVTASKIAAGQVVTSLNSLHDGVTLAAGSNITITPVGNTLTFAATGGGGGLASVAHNATLSGDGTGGTPLGIAVPLALSTSATGAAVTVSSFNGTGVLGNASSGGGTFGVEGTADGTSGISTSTINAGVFGDSSIHFGVVGFSSSGTGVHGRSSSGSGVLAQSASGVAVVAQTTSGGDAVVGQNASVAADSAGVLGVDGTGLSGQTGSLSAGVRGESSSHIGVEGLTKTGAAAVRGLNTSTANDTSGVFGRDGSGLSGISAKAPAGVRGESASFIGTFGSSAKGQGVVGVTVSGVGVAAGNSSGTMSVGLVNVGAGDAIFAKGNVQVTGNLAVTGSKSFVEPHPTDPSKQIRFVCLEGPESGTYFRGSGRVAGGFATIEVPESFRDVTDENGLTVVATPVGGPGSIWVVRKGLDRIVLQASSDVHFDYVVNGVRKAYRDFEVVGENRSFVPDGPDDKSFAQYAPEIQRRLVATGIYNADGTVNLETAKRLGWDKRWPEAQNR
jgi:hypothetical protein